MERIRKDGFEMERFRMKCLKCETILESKDQHDFVQCPCKNLAIDGGPYPGGTITGSLQDMIDVSTWREVKTGQ